METLITYQEYKRYTSQLLQWLTNKSNSILVNNRHESSVSLNRDGRVYTGDLVPMADLVVRYVTVPPRIHKILFSTIELRTARYHEFKRLERTCPWLAASNDSHYHFIEVLQSMFGALGGPAWQERQKASALENITNRFNGLHVEAGESGDESAGPAPAPQQRNGRNKRNGRKKPKPKKTAPSLPLESYQIVQDDESLTTDYLIAAYELVQEFRQLRKMVQKQWRAVAYDGLNSAVAGALSHMVVAGIQESELEIWLDFPDGYDTFESVIRSITCGDMERAHSMFGDTEKDDFKEYTMYYTYQDLLAFLKDFQENRTGKPTKRMAKELRAWNPNMNLLAASKEQRLTWRRHYTILWLYDLVNVYIRGRTTKCPSCERCEEDTDMPKEDGNWKDAGLWRRLFGMNEFAGFMAWLAMPRPGTDVTKSIRPHHVFELQCLVDSWCTARGWAPTEDAGQQLGPPAKNFEPERDLEKFLGMPNEPGCFQHGVELAADAFTKERDSLARNVFLDTSDRLRSDFLLCLGYVLVDDRLPFQSDFTRDNGLWSYSPYLCGVGLSEALELAQKLGLSMLEIAPEVMMIVHLYNEVVQKGYMTRKPHHFCERLMQLLHPSSFFVDGELPKEKFAEALFQQTQANLPFAQRRRNPRCIACSVRHQLDSDYNSLQRYHFRHSSKGTHLTRTKENTNKYYRHDSFLVKCYNADWNVHKIRDDVLDVQSALFKLRVYRSACVPTSSGDDSGVELEDTELVRLARRAGVKESELLEGHCWVTQLVEGAQPAPRDVSPATAKVRSKALTLAALKYDLQTDICGARPLSGLNYWLVVSLVLRFFQRLEATLEAGKESVAFNFRYKTDHEHKENQRLNVVLEALAERDDALLRAIARELQNDEELNRGLGPCVYWDTTDPLKGWTGPVALNTTFV